MTQNTLDSFFSGLMHGAVSENDCFSIHLLKLDKPVDFAQSMAKNSRNSLPDSGELGQALKSGEGMHDRALGLQL